MCLQEETVTQRERVPVLPPDTRKCSDGLPPLPGFALAAKVLAPDMIFKPPTVPRGWTPHPPVQAVPGAVAQSQQQQQKDHLATFELPWGQSVQKQMETHPGHHRVMTAAQRAALLAEPQSSEPPTAPTPTEVPLKQRFLAFMPSSERERMVAALKAGIYGTPPFSDDPDRQVCFEVILG